MREWATAFGVGLVALVLLIWVAFGSEIIQRVRGNSEAQTIELVVKVTGSDTEAPLVGAKVTLGLLQAGPLALDQYSLVGRRVTDVQGHARFEVAIQQDVARLEINAPGYGAYVITAPALWQAATYTENGYEVEFALDPVKAATPDR